ncbi:uncharacterized protein LOC132163025 [Corylus avellana]|uniref:uncharacterized protein LOC132163025 n=1 Tax=Corylus avellana TaxID=13451 RepID=UPI00286A1B33|nr:uncharacterized protein LOC132163025 [Corylus avellana]
MKLRDIAKRFLRFEVGNGESIHLWLDRWHPAGVLFENFGYRVVYDAISSLEAKLATVIQNGNWFWRPARSEDLVEIQARLTEVDLGLCDTPVWNASRKRVYAFILWLSMKDRLITGERLLKWGYQVVYSLWLTRNEFVHDGQPCTEEQILKKIVWEVRNRISGRGKYPRTKENIMLCSLWNLFEELLM